MKALVELAKEMNVPIMADQEVSYLDIKDRLARNTLMSIQNIDYSDKTGGGGGIGDSIEDFSLLKPSQVEKNFKKLPEALDNNEKVANMCNMELQLGKWLFPNFEVKSGLSYDEELRRMVFEGMKKRGVLSRPRKFLTQNTNSRSSAIRATRHTSLWLPTCWILPTQGILTTIRGSVAGSLVTYLQELQNVNPLEFKLPFERFLNPSTLSTRYRHGLCR